MSLYLDGKNYVFSGFSVMFLLKDPTRPYFSECIPGIGCPAKELENQ